MQELVDDDEVESNNLCATTNHTRSNMGTDGKVRHHHHDRGYSTTRTLFQHATTLANGCILLYVVLIVYLCFSDEFQFFTWHPLLLSVGWMFLMSEAIVSMSKDNLFTGTLPKSVRVRLHWILQTIALILITTGFIVVFVNKNRLNKDHFTSWHALFGIIGIGCSLPASIDGIAALYNFNLRLYISPKVNKAIHVTTGLIAFSFGGFSLILSVYTKWFERHTGNNPFVFFVGFVLVTTAVAGTLIRPIITCCNQLKDLL